MSKRWISIAGVILFLVAVFCGGFVFFYNRIQRSNAEASEPSSAIKSAESKSLIDTPFPHAQLVDTRGSKVDEQVLRTGRVVVVFVTTDCDACATESKFLQTVLHRRRDVTFYGIVPFGKRPDSANVAERMFPFRVFYDDGSSYVPAIGINRVPLKVYLEDGIIKKGWIGAATTDTAKESFLKWLDGLP
jgi:peroxiredoxin